MHIYIYIYIYIYDQTNVYEERVRLRTEVRHRFLPCRNCVFGLMFGAQGPTKRARGDPRGRGPPCALLENIRA